MKIKIILILVFLQINQISFSQNNEPFFEQAAFEFYRAEILDSFPVKKRIRVNKYTFDIHPDNFGFYTPSCLSNIEWKSNDQFKEIKSYFENQMDIDSDQFELDFSNLNKKQFKVKKNGKGKFPKLLITLPHKENTNDERIFVNIYEKHSKRFEVIYHLEFNKNGKVIDWCRNEFQTVILH